MAKEYAVYKGDNLLTIGTVKEIAKELNVSEKTVYWWATPTNTVKRVNEKTKNRKMAYIIDDKEDDDYDENSRDH